MAFWSRMDYRPLRTTLQSSEPGETGRVPRAAMTETNDNEELRAFLSDLGAALGFGDYPAVLASMSRHGRARMLCRLYGTAAIGVGLGVMVDDVDGWSWRMVSAAPRQWFKGQFILRNAEEKPLHVSRVRIRRSGKRFFLEDFAPIPWRDDPEHPGEVTPVLDGRGVEALVHAYTYDTFEGIKAPLPIVAADLDPIARDYVDLAESRGFSMRRVAAGVCLWEDFLRKIAKPRGRAAGWVAGLFYTVARLDLLDLSQADVGELTHVSGPTTGQRFKDLCQTLRLERGDIRYATVESAMLDLWASIGVGVARRRPLHEGF